MVDSTIGYGMLSFIDTFSGYHHIPMFQLDEENTTFVTSHGLYCYRVLSFGLKSVGTTYQRLMKKIFKPLIGWTVEVYIDNIVVKSKTWSEHTQLLEKILRLMRTYNMKLNLTKYVFCVRTGKFLGFMVTQRGIEVNRHQTKVVLKTLASSRKNELQHFTSRLVALERFIARFTDKLRSFFLILKGASVTSWTNECGWALDKVKHYLIKPPILSSP